MEFLVFPPISSDINRRYRFNLIHNTQLIAFRPGAETPTYTHTHTDVYTYAHRYSVAMVTWAISFLECIYFPYRSGAVQLRRNCF